MGWRKVVFWGLSVRWKDFPLIHDGPQLCSLSGAPQRLAFLPRRLAPVEQSSFLAVSVIVFGHLFIFSVLHLFVVIVLCSFTLLFVYLLHARIALPEVGSLVNPDKCW